MGAENGELMEPFKLLATGDGGRAAGRASLLPEHDEHQAADVPPGSGQTDAGHEEFGFWVGPVSIRSEPSRPLFRPEPAQCEPAFDPLLVLLTVI